MGNVEYFYGTWVSALPFDSDDYLVEYAIRPHGDSLAVTARDFRDGEEMHISQVEFDGTVLTFQSIMPSTKRKGLHRFRLLGENRIEAEFTFTVVEELRRPDTGIMARLREAKR